MGAALQTVESATAVASPEERPARPRPRTRGDCVGDGFAAARPCPWTPTCRYGLPSGDCALDLADAGEMTLRDIAKHFGVTKGRIGQIADAAIAKLQAEGVLVALLGEDVVAELRDGGGSDEEARRRRVARLLDAGLRHREIAAESACSDLFVAAVARQHAVKRRAG